LLNELAYHRTYLPADLVQVKYAVLSVIWVYQRTLSPLLPTSCRFYPSCSHYSQEAVEKYGVVKGIWLGIKRLGRCRPLGGQGYDPVP
jgi:putative membrane protein insertion efficiency factor